MNHTAEANGDNLSGFSIAPDGKLTSLWSPITVQTSTAGDGSLSPSISNEWLAGVGWQIFTTIDPSGTFMYFEGNGLRSIKRDISTGGMTYVGGTFDLSLQDSRNGFLCFDPWGKWLYQASGTLSRYSKNPLTGSLAFLGEDAAVIPFRIVSVHVVP